MNQDKVERIRRQSLYEDWPSCFCCGKPTQTGYILMPCENTSITVCDECLVKARKSYIGFCINGKEVKRDENRIK